jgi:hypothetical protein
VRLSSTQAASLIDMLRQFSQCRSTPQPAGWWAHRVASVVVVAPLAAMLERFLTALDCVDAAFISDDTLDQLPLPAQAGNTRVGGVDINRLRMRTTLAAVLALASSPSGFTVADLATKARAMTGQTPAE